MRFAQKNYNTTEGHYDRMLPYKHTCNKRKRGTSSQRSKCYKLFLVLIIICMRFRQFQPTKHSLLHPNKYCNGDIPFFMTESIRGILTCKKMNRRLNHRKTHIWSPWLFCRQNDLLWVQSLIGPWVVFSYWNRDTVLWGEFISNAIEK